MRSNYAFWMGLIVLAALVTLATKYYAYYPGDVAVERWVQSLVPQDLNWAIIAISIGKAGFGLGGNIWRRDHLSAIFFLFLESH